MPNNIGENIRRLRRARKLSQTALADLMRELDPLAYAAWVHTYISKIERGERKVSSDEVKDFARVLNVSPLELLNSSV